MFAVSQLQEPELLEGGAAEQAESGCRRLAFSAAPPPRAPGAPGPDGLTGAPAFPHRGLCEAVGVCLSKTRCNS